MVRTHVVDRLGLGLWLGLGLGLWSGRHVVGRLGSGMRVNSSFQIVSRPVGRLGLGLESGPTSWVGQG